MPDLSAHTQSVSPAKVCFWAGLGGSPNASLIQDGVLATYGSGSNPSYTYQAFWEDFTWIVGNPYVGTSMNIENLTINPNDIIYVGIQLQGSDASTMIFEITDWTTGQTTGNFSEPTYGAVDNSCAEWITEAPQEHYADGTMTIDNLANYGEEDWSGSYYYGGLGTTQSEPGMISNPYAENSCVKGIVRIL